MIRTIPAAAVSCPSRDHSESGSIGRKCRLWLLLTITHDDEGLNNNKHARRSLPRQRWEWGQDGNREKNGKVEAETSLIKE